MSTGCRTALGGPALCRIAIGAGLAVLFSWSPGSAAPLYVVQDLGKLAAGPECCGPFDLNTAGVIAGNIPSVAVSIRGDIVEQLWPGWATDINDVGHITGADFSQRVPDAALWSAGSVTLLGGRIDSGIPSVANGINNLGDVVGAYNDQAALWHGAMKTILPDLGAGETVAFDINDSGQIVGSSRYVRGGAHRAVEWIDGKITDLGTLPGYTEGFAYAINAAGAIVGASQGGGLLPNHAIMWIDGKPIDLGTLRGPQSAARDINDEGWVVGSSDTGYPYADTAAFVFDGTRMYDLNGLIVGPNPFVRSVGPNNSGLAVAEGINNRGDIGGIGFVSGELHLFLASRVEEEDEREVPQPPASALVVLGLVLLAGVAVHRPNCGAV
jgi:probable HAF family extracellular repeat protein